MATSQALEAQQKKELTTKEEKTVPARYFVPITDIYETDEALVILMEMPGVEREDISIKLENDILRVEGQVDLSKYQDMEPVYTEYNIGHYARSFTLSSKIDQSDIGAELKDGVLTLTLKKVKEALARRIEIR